jgi:Holliday junction resolvase RusA-like endonuclease
MTHLFTIQGKLANLNDHDAVYRGNKFAATTHKNKETKKVIEALKGQGPAVKYPVFITFHWRHSTKHDPDNIRFAAKYILDGMVKAGILPDDNQRWVKGFGDDFTKVEDGQDNVLVEVEELIEDDDSH